MRWSWRESIVISLISLSSVYEGRVLSYHSWKWPKLESVRASCHSRHWDIWWWDPASSYCRWPRVNEEQLFIHPALHCYQHSISFNIITTVHCERVCYIIFSVWACLRYWQFWQRSSSSLPCQCPVCSPQIITGQCYTACYITLMSTSSCDPRKPRKIGLAWRRHPCWMGPISLCREWWVVSGRAWYQLGLIPVIAAMRAENQLFMAQSAHCTMDHSLHHCDSPT